MLSGEKKNLSNHSSKLWDKARKKKNDYSSMPTFNYVSMPTAHFSWNKDVIRVIHDKTNNLWN